MAQPRSDIDELKREKTLLKYWARKSKKSINIVIQALNRHDAYQLNRGVPIKRVTSDPMILLLGIAIIFVGERLKCWSLRSTHTTNTSGWTLISTAIKNLCGHTNHQQNPHEGTHWPVIGGLLFGQQMLRFSYVSDLLDDE